MECYPGKEEVRHRRAFKMANFEMIEVQLQLDAIELGRKKSLLRKTGFQEVVSS